MKTKYVFSLALLLGLSLSWLGCSKYTAPKTSTVKSARAYIDLIPANNTISANGKEYYLFLAHTKENKAFRFITDDVLIASNIKDHHKDTLVVLEGTQSLPFNDKTVRKIKKEIKEKFGDDGVTLMWVYNWGMEHKCGETPCNATQYNNYSPGNRGNKPVIRQ